MIQSNDTIKIIKKIQWKWYSWNDAIKMIQLKWFNYAVEMTQLKWLKDRIKIIQL